MARVRKQPGTREALMQYAPIVVLEPEKYKGKWHEVFENTQPIQIEVGMGKGKFVSTLARQNPDINYIGIEVIEEVLLDAVKRMNRAEGIPDNLRLVWINASLLEDLFAPGEVDCVYLNFSDPWPKTRHAKRRLTHKGFLDQYAAVLKAEGQVHFKPDNQGLFNYSMESIPEAGWTIEAATFDLHNSWMNEGNVMTEYEIKFSSEGNPICKLIASRGLHQE